MICSNCSHENIEQATFCTKCARKLIVSSTPAHERGYEKPLLRVAVVFFSLLLLIVTYSLSIDYEEYTDVLLIDSAFAILVLVFCAVYPKKWKRILSLRRINPILLAKVAFAMPFLALLVSYVADFLFGVGVEQITYITPFLFSEAPLLLALVSTALFPAIFEELAFRGIILRELAYVTSLKNAIFLSAVLFTILHFSSISAIWIFPIGLLFGYLRAKYRTLWYGIVGHFIYNSCVVLMEFYEYEYFSL